MHGTCHATPDERQTQRHQTERNHKWVPAKVAAWKKLIRWDTVHTLFATPAWRHFAELCHGLQSIDFDHFEFDCTASDILIMSTHCEDLRVLRVSKLTDALTTVLAKCTELEYVETAWYSLSDTGMQHISRLPKLATLILHNPTFGCSITPAGCGRYLSQMNNLKSLSMPRSDITDATIACLAGCPHLERVDFSRCDEVTGTGFRALAELKHLQCVSVASCSALSHDGIQAIASLVQLRALDLSVTSLSRLRGGKHVITDNNLQVLSRLSNLTELNIPRTRQVTDRGIIAIARSCRRLKSIAVVDSRAHAGLTSKSLLSLAQCVDLRHINLKYAIDPTQPVDAAVDELAKSCPHLQSLNLAGAGITDRSAHSLASYCNKLEGLNVRDCRQITQAGIDLLIKMCPRLRKLEATERFFAGPGEGFGTSWGTSWGDVFNGCKLFE